MMKRKLLLGLLLISSVALATIPFGPINHPRTITVVAASSAIPVDFGNGSDSLLFDDLQGQQYAKMMVYNNTAGVIGLLPYQINQASLTAEEATKYRVQVVTGGTATFDLFPIYKYLYVRSETGAALTTGDVIINLW